MNLGGTEDLVVMMSGDEVVEVEDMAAADTEVEQGTTVVLGMVHRDEEDTDCAMYQRHFLLYSTMKDELILS